LENPRCRRDRSVTDGSAVACRPLALADAKGGCRAQNRRPRASLLTIANSRLLLQRDWAEGWCGALSRLGHFGGSQAEGAAGCREVALRAIAAHCSPPPEDLAVGVNGIARASRRPSRLDCSRALSQGRGVPTTPVGADSAQVSRDLDRPPTGCGVVPRRSLRCGQTRRP
jgi:hypothetical protein